MQRGAKKCEKEEKANLAKVDKAIKAGDREQASIYAQNAIRNKNEALNMLRMSSRVDAVAGRVQSAARQNQVSNSMQGVVRAMGIAMKNMDIDTVTNTMDNFEQQFEDLDVRSAYMEGAMNNSTAQSTPQDQVDELIRARGEANALDVSGLFDEAGPVGTGRIEQPAAPQPAAAEAKDDLSARLEALRPK